MNYSAQSPLNVSPVADIFAKCFNLESWQAPGSESFFAVNFNISLTMTSFNDLHFSPIVAYNQAEDEVLILDVERYKYPPVWVRKFDLFTAMTTPSSKEYGGLVALIGPPFEPNISFSCKRAKEEYIGNSMQTVCFRVSLLH